MKAQYGDACLSLQQLYEWTRKFMNGISSVTDSPRPGQVRRRGPAGGARIPALSAKRIFFSKGMRLLPKRWNTYMERNGNYI